MGILTNPTDSVMKITNLKRWQRDWINKRRSINYSGLVQEMIIDIIKREDPEYHAANINNIKPTKKNEVTKKLLEK